MATLLGLNPAPVDRCRVLELGCAVGGNLIPMAYGLPGSEFVGIDSSAAQIAEGQAAVADLGLKNITFQHRDILEAGPDLGRFDYVIAHGVYSWVPRAVQDKILEMCKRHLAPQGVGYVSYNTYPGWHMINIVRGLMLYATRSIADPLARAERGRKVLDTLAGTRPDETDAYGSFLRMYSGFLDGKLGEGRHRSDALLLHDEMEEVNDPVYFYQFVDRAARHGLQYLADFHHMGGGALAPDVTRTLKDLAKNLVELEQYLDFVQNRTFRQTLLCHQGIDIDRKLAPDRVSAFRIASRARPEEPDPDIHSVSVVKFRGQDGAVLSIDHPVSKAAMLCLAEVWPRSMSFEQLFPAARARLRRRAKPGGRSAVPPPGGRSAVPPPNPEHIDAQVLGANLLSAYGYSDSLVELHVHAPQLAAAAGQRPVASAVARLQAESSEMVTNMLHVRVTLDGFERYLIRYLDGSRDRDALLDLLLAGPVAEGALRVQAGDEPVDDVRTLLAEELETKLGWLAHAALLVGPL
jgi:methyltransferase-like protein